MNQEIKTISTVIIILFILSFILSLGVEARSGCCSHHGGVCTYQCPGGTSLGYMCCDGTSLSATCDPYYPDCPKYVPKKTIETKPEPKTELKIESNIESETNSEIENLPIGETSESEINPETYSPESYTADISKTQSDKNSNSWIWWVIGIGIAGIIGYNYFKKK